METLSDLADIVNDPKADGLNVDVFLVLWHPDGTEMGGGGREGQMRYAASRGKWDDFWQRKVDKADRATPQRSHSMPVRGYVEVVIDGYR